MREIQLFKFNKIYIMLIVIFIFFGFNPAAQAMTQGSDFLILVNQEYPLDAQYKPADLENLAKHVRAVRSEVLLRKDAAEAFIKMYQEMHNQGIKNIQAVSGYRPYDLQVQLFNNKIDQYKRQGYETEAAIVNASQIVAIPGTSEHQSGLALDVATFEGTLTEEFANTDAGKWLKENSHHYGFILRFPKDKEDITKITYEPWHFRYVGIPHSNIIYENDWCLEEYIEYLQKEQAVEVNTDKFSGFNIYYDKDWARKYENAIDRSSDNSGGYIVTTRYKLDPLKNVMGPWGERYFKFLFQIGYLNASDYALPNYNAAKIEFAKI